MKVKAVGVCHMCFFTGLSWHLPSWLFIPWDEHCCPGSSKVLTVQVVNVHLLQFVHLGYCWSPFRLFIALKLSWAYSEFWWFALSFWKTLLCKSMQSSLFLRNATRVCFVCPEQHLKDWKPFTAGTRWAGVSTSAVILVLWHLLFLRWMI